MKPIITAFAQSPDRGRGLARDMAVRWALEEVGQPYDVRLLTFDELKEPTHRSLQPFGQIPTYEEGAVALFESAAIVLHIGERFGVLLPDDPGARARAITWMFAAKSTIEPPIVARSMVSMLERERPWFNERISMLEDDVRVRLGEFSAYLGDRQWLDEAFNAADVVMITVLRRLNGSGLLEAHPNVAAYVTRGEKRPAFERAFADQLAVFEAISSAN